MERLALLVGVDQYVYSGFMPLKAPVSDIERLGSLLQSRGDFDIFPSLNDDYDTVRGRILDLVESRRPSDTILFYYSGHGIRDFEGELYLTTSRSNPERPRRDSVASSDLQRWLSLCRAQNQIIILDCCYSGAFSANEGPSLSRDGVSSSLASAADFTSNTGYGSFVLMASDRGEVVPAGDVDGADVSKVSHYTDLLIEGLKGAAAPDDEHVTVPQVADYLEREGPARLQIRPQSRRSAHGAPWLVRNPNSGLHKIPDDIKSALEASSYLTRMGAVWQLGKYLDEGQDESRTRAAAAMLNQRRAAETHVHVVDAIDFALARYFSSIPPQLREKLENSQLAQKAAEAEASNAREELRALGDRLSDAVGRRTRADEVNQALSKKTSDLKVVLAEKDRALALEIAKGEETAGQQRLLKNQLDATLKDISKITVERDALRTSTGDAQNRATEMEIARDAAENKRNAAEKALNEAQQDVTTLKVDIENAYVKLSESNDSIKRSEQAFAALQARHAASSKGGDTQTQISSSRIAIYAIASAVVFLATLFGGVAVFSNSPEQDIKALKERAARAEDLRMQQEDRAERVERTLKDEDGQIASLKQRL